MDYKVEENINELGGKIDIVFSITKALTSSILGTEELSINDASNFVFLLEEKLKDLKNTHDSIITDLHI